MNRQVRKEESRANSWYWNAVKKAYDEQTANDTFDVRKNLDKIFNKQEARRIKKVFGL